MCIRWSLHHYYIFLALASPHRRRLFPTIQLTAHVQRNNARLEASHKQIVLGWPPVACKNNAHLAPSRIQIVPDWLSVACKLNPRGRQS